MKPPRARPAASLATLSFEKDLMAQGFARIAGVDEAGRGPLAGPVTAAAVILDPGQPIQGLADSKLLKEARREELFAEILRKAVVGVAFEPAQEIDRSDIRKATLRAMKKSVAALAIRPAFVLIDGRDIPPGLPCPGRAVIDGDALSASIAAASIIAKVLRDRLMRRMDPAYPGYGFANHAGYGTALHKAGIAALGPCRLHRLSFAPFKNGTHFNL
jgi:ribonuclease HII